MLLAKKLLSINFLYGQTIYLSTFTFLTTTNNEDTESFNSIRKFLGC